MKKIVIIQNENQKNKVISILGNIEILTVNKFNIKDQIKMVKLKQAFGAIIIDENWEVSFLHKNKGAWKIENTLNFDMLFFNKKKIRPKTNSDIFKEYLKFEISEDVSYSNNSFSFSAKIEDEILTERLKFFFSNDWAGIEGRNSNKSIKYRVSNIEFGNENIDLDSFVGSWLINNSLIKNEKNIYEIKYENSIVKIQFLKSKINVDIISVGENEVNIHYEHNKILKDFKNEFDLEKNKNKIGIKNTILSLIGLTSLIIMIFVTFGMIFSPSNLNDALSIFFIKETYKYPWVYLIYTNFIIDLLFSWFTITFLHKIATGKWPNIHETITYILSIEVRGAVRFLTGSWAVSVIAWGYFIKKRNDVNTSNVITMFSVGSLLALGTNLIVGLPMMITGTIYLTNIFEYLHVFGFVQDGDYATFYTLLSFGWISNIWNYVHHGFLALVSFIYPIHFIYNQVMTKYILNFKVSDAKIQMENREYSILRLKQNYTLLFSKERMKNLWLLFLIIIIQFFNVLIIMPSILNLVENSMYSNNQMNDIQKLTYNDWYQIASIRLIINWASSLPIIDLIPLGVPEMYQVNFYQWLFIYQHKFTSLNSLNLSISRTFAEEVTFINRFFHMYLRKIISIITLISLFGYGFIKKITVK